jgi:hypothetical protein
MGRFAIQSSPLQVEMKQADSMVELDRTISESSIKTASRFKRTSDNSANPQDISGPKEPGGNFFF